MAENLIVNIAGLRQAAGVLDQRSAELAEIYTNSILPVLSISSQEIKAAGLDYNSALTNIKGLFNSVTGGLGELSDCLVNKIIPQYEDVKATIQQQFNESFVQTMNDYINQINQ